MNIDERLDRILSELLDEGTPSRVPDRLEPETLRALRDVRRMPRWLTLIQENPMRTNSHVAVGSPTVRVAVAMAATLLLTLVVASAGIAGSRFLAADRPIVVDPTGQGNVTTITEAVALAEDGDTVIVRPGTYDEQVIVAKDITIRGDGDRTDVVVEVSEQIPRGVTWTDRKPAAFLLEDSDAILENLTLRGPASRIVIAGGAPTLRTLHLGAVGQLFGVDPGCAAYQCLDGVHITEGSTATIEDGVFDRVGMTVVEGSSPTILRSEFSVGAVWFEGDGEPYLEANSFDSDGPWAIAIQKGSRPTLLRNVVRGDNTGIALGGGSRPILIENTIERTRTGLSIPYGNGASVEGNRFLENDIAISIVSSDVRAKDNLVREGQAGIVTTGAASPHLEGNEVYGLTGRGIAIDGRSSPTLIGNISCDNNTNLWIGADAEPVIEESNEICPDASAGE